MSQYPMSFEYRQHTIFIIVTDGEVSDAEVQHFTLGEEYPTMFDSVEEAIEFINTRVTIPLKRVSMKA